MPITFYEQQLLQRDHPVQYAAWWGRWCAGDREYRPEVLGRPVAARPVTPVDESFITKVRQFVQCVSGPKVDDATYRYRLAICRSNDCGKTLLKGKYEYCGACGCPKWRMARLKIKLRFAQLACPMGMFNAVDPNGDGKSQVAKIDHLGVSVGGQD